MLGDKAAVIHMHEMEHMLIEYEDHESGAASRK